MHDLYEFLLDQDLHERFSSFRIYLPRWNESVLSLERLECQDRTRSHDACILSFEVSGGSQK